MVIINDLCKQFDGDILFDHFNATIETGSFTLIMGASGSGKTTLLNMIGALEPIDSGEILFDCDNISKLKNKETYLRTKVGFLFQNFALIDNKSVYDNLNIVSKNSRSSISIDDALKQVNLLEKKDTKVYKLSGGEQQRVALARLLIKKCELILADEPTGSLDFDNARVVMNYLKEMNSKGKTIIVVTHDHSLSEYATQIINLDEKK